MSLIVKQIVNECWQPLFIKRKGVRYVIIMGGRGAGRSYVASQYGTAKLISPDYFRCAIMRLVHSDIRKSIYQEIVDRIDEQGITDHVRINDSEMRFRYKMKKEDGTFQENSINAIGFRTSDKTAGGQDVAHSWLRVQPNDRGQRSSRLAAPSRVVPARPASPRHPSLASFVCIRLPCQR